MKQLKAKNGWWRWGIVQLLAMLAVGLFAQDDADDLSDGPARFHAVESWRGTFVAKARPNPEVVEKVRQTYLAGGVTRWTFEYEAYQYLEFTLTEFEDSPATWTGEITKSEYSGSLARSYYAPEINTYNYADGRVVKRDMKGYKQESWEAETNGPLDYSNGKTISLNFHRQSGWSVKFSVGSTKTELRHRLDARRAVEYDTSPGGPIYRWEEEHWLRSENTVFQGMGSTGIQAYPKRGLLLFASSQETSTSAVLSESIATIWDYSVYLEPVSLEELRLEIEEPAGYRDWRPETTPECTAGPPLAISARLTTAKGGPPKTKVAQFVWELIGTSREPGVAMNYPVGAEDGRYDLDLGAEGGQFELSNDNQVLTRAVEAGYEDKVKVLPYDFGGWSTLQVTAIMEDGRRVQGKLRGQSAPGLRLPKRAPGSHIADGWKEQHKGGADNLDDEQVEGQEAKGDGFSLYEEYRGWIVNRAQVGGDPQRKDFFVLNLIGADAQAGIDLFEQVSQLRVHDRLRRSEMSQETRRMNGNRRQGAHVVDQHGVWIKTYTSKAELGGGGAYTVLNKPGVSGRPGLVTGIGLLPRTDDESDFNKPFNLAPGERVGAYDRAVAHELLHSVGVEHHGEGDRQMVVGYVSTRNPLNKLGRPYYGTSVDAPIDLRTEEGEDVAARDVAEYEKFRKFNDFAQLDTYLKEGAAYIQRNGADYNPLFGTPQAYADFHIEILLVYCFMHLKGIVGADQGEHSGAEDCLLRYYFAKFYEGKEPAAVGNKLYYLVGEGTEHVGREICRDGNGTGVNSPDHVPQSRYGNAANGDCFSQICPNDAVPPRAAK